MEQLATRNSQITNHKPQATNHKPLTTSHKPLPTLLALVLLLALVCRPGAVRAGEGDDLEIGGPGTDPGQFSELRDIAFDTQGDLYTLEGWRWDQNRKQFFGSQRVQKFSPAGKSLLAFGVRNDGWVDPKLVGNPAFPQGEKNDPERIAVDGTGNIYVTQPAAGVVEQFGPDGKLIRNINIPWAMAICSWTVAGKEQIAVLASRNEVVNGHWAWQGGDHLDVIDPATGALGKPIALPKTFTGVEDMAADRTGNLYILAAVNQIYKVDPGGKLLKTIGAAANTRNPDGSEPLHSVAVDSHGNIYTMTWGNPGLVTRYDPDVTTVTQREGQFRWADPWSPASNYVPIAIDPADRLWVATTHQWEASNPNFHYYRPSPVVLRTQADFLDPKHNQVTVHSALTMGFQPSLNTNLPYSIAYDLKPIPIDLQVKAANRQIQECSVRWDAYDMYKTEVGHGQFDLPLQDGTAASQAFEFTPPGFGWYTVSAVISSNNQPLLAIGKHFGVTPKYPGMVSLAVGESVGGWEDVPRQMFAGLTNIRLHTDCSPKSLDGLEAQVAQATKYGATFFVQISDKKNVTPDLVTAAVTQFKGKVPVWEIVNEPNFGMSPEAYVELLKTISPLIHQIDPAAKVMGPDVCGIDLGWYERFYKAGGGPLVDILSEHDYEGHESIDPVHWRWKYGALREIMAKYGDAKKELWQTERAITGVRGDNFLGGAQAVRVTLHRDLLEVLGVPPEHNNHYYLNEGGYSDVPSYLWSSTGPHPGALALRTRYAMTLGRKYAGPVDFGPTGNKLFLGLRYQGNDGSTMILRNLGTLDQPLDVAAKGGATLDLVDSFGNAHTVPVKNGKARLTITQMPIYLRLARGQEVSPPLWDFGANLAPQATFTYSGGTDSAMNLLNNGIIETFHAGNPDGGTDGKKIWQGKLPLDPNGQVTPQTLDITFPQPTRVSKVIVYSVRADNAFCALLDYDLQYSNGKDWVTLDKVQTPCPLTDKVDTAQSGADTWLLDNNLFVNRFAPVTTDRLRLVIRKTSHGFVPDDRSRAWGNLVPESLMLREVEVYGGLG